MSDLIDRQKAVKALLDCGDWFNARNDSDAGRGVAQCLMVIYELQSAEPERKTGKWSHEQLASTSGGAYAVIRCSECNAQFPMWETPYCPSCGAKMDC